MDNEGVSTLAGQAILKIEDPASYRWLFGKLKDALGRERFENIGVSILNSSPHVRGVCPLRVHGW